MSDIFISYSSNDREQAMMLSELLTSAGLSVWIDRHGIGAATSWSAEIVDAIDACKILVLILSPSSNQSKNVAREIALAAERDKKILPLDFEPVSLSRELAYYLAGIQRTPMTNIDAIIRALDKLGLEAINAPQPPKFVKESDGRKTLMILPFEDFSPTGDNGWFADGIVSELINALTNVKALKVLDAQTTKEYKGYKGTLPVYARETGIRYFVQGDVRKFGDQIKISSRLLDIETGDHLWQDVMKGTMEDIFDIQERVAARVVEGLKLHLSSEEKAKLAEYGTQNAEAFEFDLKAREHFQRGTREGLELSARLLTEAIALDPGYARVYASKALVLIDQYRMYERNPAVLDEALRLLDEARHLKPDLWYIYGPLAQLLLLQGKHDEAEQVAKDFIRKTPEDPSGYFTLGQVYWMTGRHVEAIAPYEESLRRRPNDLNALWNLTIACRSINDIAKCKEWASVAIPKFEYHLRLFPDDELNRVTHAVLLHFADRNDEARVAARKLDNVLDGRTMYNVSNLHCALKDYTAALTTCRKAIEAGFQHTELLKMFLENEEQGIGKLRGTPEYEELKKIVEAMEHPVDEKETLND